MARCETPEDERNQARIAAHIEQLWRCRLRKLQQWEHIDYAMLPGRVGERIVAWVEIKCRKITCRQYPDIMCSVHKWVPGVTRALITRLPYYFIVECMDDGKIIYHEFDRNLKLRVEWRGRTNRGPTDPDVEPCVMIPVSHFSEVTTGDQSELW